MKHHRKRPIRISFRNGLCRLASARKNKASINDKAAPHHCFWCNVFLTDQLHDDLPPLSTARTIDHVIPLSRGGEDKKINRVPSCHGCNRRKAATMPERKVLKMLGLPILADLDPSGQGR